MATRFYFPADTAADVSPAIDSGWVYTSELVRRNLAHVKGSSAITEGTQIGPWDKDVGLALDRQYVSAPLQGAQSISGTCKCQLMTRQFGALDVWQALLHASVWDTAGTTKRGDLIGGVQSVGALGQFINNATHQNKTIAYAGTGISTVAAQHGDRLVVEIGYSNGFAGTPNPVAAAKWGENATDLPEDETQTTNGAGWIEFSATLAFQTGGGGGGASSTYAIVQRRDGVDLETLVTLAQTAAVYRAPYFQPTSLAQLLAMEIGASRGPEDATYNDVQVNDAWLMLEFLEIGQPSAGLIDLKQFRKRRFGGGAWG